MRKTLTRLAVPVTFLVLLLLCVGCGKPALRARKPAAPVPETTVEAPLEETWLELPEAEPVAEPEPPAVEEEEPVVEEEPAVEEKAQNPDLDL